VKTIIVVCLFFIVGQAYAEERLVLSKINNVDFLKLESIVKGAIKKDQNQQFSYDLIENGQSFDLKVNSKTKYRLVPVAYESMKARNRVCALSILSPENRLLDILNMHFEIAEEDEIVAACSGVNAVTLENINGQKLLVYLLAYEITKVNYGDTVFIASIRSDKIIKDEDLTACVSNNKDIGSIGKIRKAMKKCLSKTALPGKK